MIMAVHTMTAKNVNALAGHEPEAWRISETLRRLITRLESWITYQLRYRTTVEELGRLTDYQLADVGVLRGEIAAVARAAARRAGA
jgi:uncharacterized protein YjiS (DUF1127 family)